MPKVSQLVSSLLSESMLYPLPDATFSGLASTVNKLDLLQIGIFSQLCPAGCLLFQGAFCFLFMLVVTRSSGSEVRRQSEKKKRKRLLLQHLGERLPTASPGNTAALGDLMRFHDNRPSLGTGRATLKGIFFTPYS